MLFLSAPDRSVLRDHVCSVHNSRYCLASSLLLPLEGHPANANLDWGSPLPRHARDGTLAARIYFVVVGC